MSQQEALREMGTQLRAIALQVNTLHDHLIVHSALASQHLEGASVLLAAALGEVAKVLGLAEIANGS